jgi:hypothetical protein
MLQDFHQGKHAFADSIISLAESHENQQDILRI